ncbi:testis-specific gene 10 protein [Chanos chanos]|uniref:Testis-specific gene 10 protein n=1 Tax=Chanos chanos TaxID=29144 RepID=A0A6J2VUF0_CHACN|nr:testis-specific gene 10 protein [Chanos chanos]
MLRSRRSASPTRAPPTCRSPTRQPPVKGGTYDSELMRALRERDELQNMLEKYERHLSEMQANVKVLMADRDKTSRHYQQAQEEIAALRREVMKSKATRGAKNNVTAQAILKRVEAEQDEAAADLHRMSTERDSLRERLKISQETAISEKAHLEQRVEDLQNAILTLEQERVEQRSRHGQMRETMMGLEDEIRGLGRKLASTEEELNRVRNECSILRLSSSQTETALTDSQRRLTHRIGELQKVQERNKMLDEKNDSLLMQVNSLREEVSELKGAVSELDERRDSLQDQLDRKNDQLCSAHSQLDVKEKTIRSLQLRTEELEETVQALRREASGRDRELDVTRRKLSDADEELSALRKVKDTTLRENTQFRNDLEKARLDNQALQLKLDNTTQDIEDLRRKVQDYVTDIARTENLLSTKEQECRELQENRRRASVQAESWEGQAKQAEAKASELRLELQNADTDRRRLREKVESLETSLQVAVCSERSCTTQLSEMNRSLQDVEEELRQVKSEHTHTQSDLDKTRELCVKLDASKEAVQRELDSCHSEVEMLRKQLTSERLSMKSLESLLVSTREKELQRQLSQQERDAEIQLLRDKLTVADSKASTQGREVTQLRTRAAQLETDLDMTKRQLSAERFERERAMQELRRQGLSSTLSPLFSSTLRSSSPVRRSLSPRQSWSPERAYHSAPDTLVPERSSERSVAFRDLYD